MNRARPADGGMIPARARRLERRTRRAGGVLSVCGYGWLSAEWWISTEEIDAVRRSEGVTFGAAVELLQTEGCPVCRGIYREN